MRLGTLATLSFACVLAATAPAIAIPLFAHEYHVGCETCHTVIPHLNEFGTTFLALGYRIPGAAPGLVFPFAAKANLVASSERQGSGASGAGLPKAIVDEVEVFVAGAIGSRASYLVEQYLVDGGEPGLTRDAWIIDRVNPWGARVPVYAQAGSFTLPLPADPETFRESYQHYSLFDQRVGDNPFNFFDPKIGVRIGVGDPMAGPSFQFFAGPGHDRQSGLQTIGIDFMGAAQEVVGTLTFSLYRYEGTRPVLGSTDRFERTGYGITFDGSGRWTSETVLQTGWDSDCGIAGIVGCASSGGFTQLRYSFNRHLFALARYEGTNDPTGGFTRDGVLLMGYGPTENSRITIEDVIEHTPATTHTVNLQFTIAY